MELTKEQRRQIAAEEIRSFLAEARPEASKHRATWRGLVWTLGAVEMMLTAGDVTANGMTEILNREGLD